MEDNGRFEAERNHLDLTDERKRRRELIDPPVEPTADKLHRVVRVATSILPGGGTILEVLSALASPLQRRQTKWMLLVEAELERLIELGEWPVAELVQDESFISTLAQATAAALRTHQEEKLSALKNAVINSLAPGRPDEDLRAVFLNLVDDLTPWHLRLLRLCTGAGVEIRKPTTTVKAAGEDGRMRVVSRHVSSRCDAVGSAFPELRERPGLYLFLLTDLEQRGLVERSADEGQPPSELIRVSEVGREFLRFVTVPEGGNGSLASQVGRSSS